MNNSNKTANDGVDGQVPSNTAVTNRRERDCGDAEGPQVLTCAAARTTDQHTVDEQGQLSSDGATKARHEESVLDKYGESEDEEFEYDEEEFREYTALLEIEEWRSTKNDARYQRHLKEETRKFWCSFHKDPKKYPH